MNIPQGIEGKASWLAVATSARVLGHPLVWSVMTAIFILIGYFWLQYHALPYSTELAAESTKKVNVSSTQANQNDSDADLKSHWNPEIYQQIETQDVMPISHHQDDNRADNYRRIIKLEAKLLPLLNKGSEYLAVEPIKLRAAFDLYMRALEIEPGNSTAKSGLNNIHQIRIDRAGSAIKLDDLPAAQQEIDRLIETHANQMSIAKLMTALETKRTQLSQLQRQAQKQQKATPATPATPATLEAK